MSLANLLSAEQIIPEMKATERWSAIVELIDLLVSLGKIKPPDRDPILAALRQREETMSTGIGFGIAPGAAIAGHLVDLYGASPAYLVPAVSGILAAAVALSTGYSTRPLTMIGERLTHDRGSLN